MFGRFFHRTPKPKIAAQPIGEEFPWPAGCCLKPLDPVTVALPIEMWGPDDSIGSMIDCADDVEIGMSQCGRLMLLRLKPGMSASIRKNCMAVLVADDRHEMPERRIEVIPADN
jgi:hypothetical protein